MTFKSKYSEKEVQEFWDNSLLVLVLYNDTISNSVGLESILKSFALFSQYVKVNLYVYDNSPRLNKQEISFTHPNLNLLRVVKDPENGGLSVAYNSGIHFAKKNGKLNVLFLDQDTCFSNNFCVNYASTTMNNPTEFVFCPILKIKDERIFSPSRYRFHRGWFTNYVQVGVNNLFKLIPVNSGVLIKITLFNQVGMYDQNLRVDFIDFQFMEKVRSYHPNFVVNDVVGTQDFSSQTDDVDSQKARFEIYLKDIRSINKDNLITKLNYDVILIMHCLMLTFRFRTFDFLKRMLHSE